MGGSDQAVVVLDERGRNVAGQGPYRVQVRRHRSGRHGMAQAATVSSVVRTRETRVRREHDERDRGMGYGDSRSIVFVLMRCMVAIEVYGRRGDRTTFEG